MSERRVAWAFLAWAVTVTAAFLAANGADMWHKLLERMGGG
ncbi:MAG: hypothetical protein AB7G62_05705 [Magnetospirillum sp.]